MTNRTQRLFCFLVALLATGNQNALRAQVAGMSGSGIFINTPEQGSLLLNSTVLIVAPAPLPALSFTSGQEKALSGNFDQNRGILPYSGSVSANYPAFLSQNQPLSLYSGLTALPLAENLTRQYIPSNNYYIQSGFFCKREWELERSTHIPFRFRLGSLRQCNALEGKQ